MGRVSAMIGGEAGFGIMSSGELLAKCLTHGGLYVYTNIEYPSLIRGGHNAIHVTASDEPIVSYYPELQGVIAKQTEDELAAGLMAIGANYQGLRAACGTSGGGFSLMVEGLGLAAIAEIPMVYVDVQRAGPATGLPTWSGQGDLRFILHASQDEFPRFVIAPGDAREAFYCAFEALNLAEMFQVPVIILSDKNLAEHHQTWEPYNTKGLVINRGKLLKHGEAQVDPSY